MFSSVIEYDNLVSLFNASSFRIFCMHEYRRFILKELVDPFIVLETCVNVSDDFALDSLLSLIHISEPTRPRLISYAVFCLKKFFFNDTATTEIYTV